MLSAFFQYLKSKALVVEKPIKDIDSSCCSSSRPVIDFDHFKEEYMKLHTGKAMPKSADALLLKTNGKPVKMVFIEMKDMQFDLKKIAEESKEEESDLSKRQKLMRQKIKETYQNFRIDQKTIDSLGLILDAARHFQYNCQIFPYILSDQCEIEFFVLIGVSPRDYVKLHIDFLPYKYAFKYWLFEHADLLPAYKFDEAFP